MELDDIFPKVEDPLELDELERMAHRHGVTVDHVLEVIKETHPRTRQEVEDWLEQRYPGRVKN